MMKLLASATLFAYIVILNGQPIENELVDDNPSDFNFVKQAKTWLEADEYCKNWGGRLMTISNEIQNAYVYHQYKKRGMGSPWIGYNDRKKEGKFEWNYADSCNKYTNWRGGEPNGGRRENCVEMWGDKWNDLDCQQHRHFVCHRVKGFTCKPTKPKTVRHVHEVRHVVYEKVPADENMIENVEEETQAADEATQ